MIFVPKLWTDASYIDIFPQLIAFLSDKDIVPNTFPGVVAISPNTQGDPLLNNKYRKFGKEEFEYFVIHLLSRTQPKRTKYNKNTRPIKSISECFTPSDEAFALLVLDNELHVWEQQLELERYGKRTIKEMRLEKKYTKGYTSKKGATCGWSRNGMNIYNKLRTEIRNLRQETVVAEQQYMEKFRKDENWEEIPNTDNNNSQEEDCDDYVDDEEDQLEDVSEWIMKEHLKSGENINVHTV